MACAICEVRRPRRYCPGVRGDICSLCCGNEREQTVDCPLDCPFLRESRQREKLPEVDPASIPNKDIRVTDPFLREHEHLLLFLSGTLAEAALQGHGIVDYDVRQALEALIRTYRTRESGLIYDTRPTNPMAAHIYGEMRRNLEAMERNMAQRTGMTTLRDAAVLGVLVFLQRLEYQNNNGKRKGRAFIDLVRQFAGSRAQPEAPSIVQP